MSTFRSGSARGERRASRTALALSASFIAAAIACGTLTPDEAFESRNSSGSDARPASGGSDSLSAGGRGQAEIGGDAGAAAQLGGAGGHDSAGPGEVDCGPAPVNDGPFSRAALRSAAAECAMWHYCNFERDASTLHERVSAHWEERGDESLSAARAAWTSAILSWSRAEVFQFGPLGSKVETAGKDPVHGQGIRDLIYAWPVVARCRVEDQVLGRGYEASWSPVLISSRGLFGLEYLLFYTGEDCGCSANSATAKAWANSSSGDIAAAKLDYLLALSGDVLGQVQRLRHTWSPAGENFKQTFIDAAGYESEQQALNVMAWSLIYIERETKDWKVGVPAGRTLMHPVTVAETPFAELRTEALRENLAGFRALFQGCGAAGEGLGFDDWLSEVGQSALASDILAALDAAEARARALPAFPAASQAELEAMYEALRALTTLLKSQFFGAGSTLNLKLPASVASDTD
jgi:predicted lipoprotein